MKMKFAFTQITSLLQKFSSEELMTLIPELFSEVGWEAVSASIKKNRLSCQRKFIAMTTATLYEACNPSKESIQFVVCALQFYSKIYHNNQDWHGIHLTDQVEEVSDSNHIERNIIRAFRTDARDAEVMLKIDDLIYVMTIEKKTSPKGVKYKRPFFFVYNHNLDEPYGFYSPKFPGYEDLITYCCKGMGFEKYDEISLFGNDVISLFGMIERDVNKSRNLQVAVDFHPVTVVEEEGVLDFRLGNEREKYADAILPGLTKLQTYTVQAQNEWRGAPYSPELEGIKIHSAVTFSSSATNIGVEDILKEMIKRGVVHLPVPAYIANLPNVPTNTIELSKENSDLNESESNENSY